MNTVDHSKSVWQDPKKQQEKVLRLYSPASEKIMLTFNPLRMSHEPDWNPQWEDWSCYYNPLVVYRQDYDKLLLPYLKQIYPTKDAFNGTPEVCFDVCFDNWIGIADWNKIIAAVENDLDIMEPEIKSFYEAWLAWLKEALCYTTIIVVEGNQ